MSLTVIVEHNGRQLSRDGRCMNMDDVLQYVRGWTSPTFGHSGMVLIVQDRAETRRFDMQISAKRVTLRPC